MLVPSGPRARALVDVHLEADDPGDAGASQTACDHRRVRGQPATGGDHCGSSDHSCHVVGAGLGPDQDHLATGARPRGRRRGVENDLSDGRSRAGREATPDHLGSVRRSELGVQQRLQLRAIDSPQRFVEVDAPLVDEVDRDPKGRRGTALADADLQQPQLSVLDGELDVAHVQEALLQRVRVALQRHRRGEGPPVAESARR